MIAYVVLFRAHPGNTPGVDSVWLDDEDSARTRVGFLRAAGIESWFVPSLVG